jgi:hypothetical protein
MKYHRNRSNSKLSQDDLHKEEIADFSPFMTAIPKSVVVHSDCHLLRHCSFPFSLFLAFNRNPRRQTGALHFLFGLFRKTKEAAQFPPLFLVVGCLHSPLPGLSNFPSLLDGAFRAVSTCIGDCRKLDDLPKTLRPWSSMRMSHISFLEAQTSLFHVAI